MFDDKLSMMLGNKGPNAYNLANARPGINAYGMANEKMPVDPYRLVEGMEEMLEKIKVLKGHAHQLHQSGKGHLNCAMLMQKLNEAESIATQLHRKANSIRA
jgi:hypothetical protein